MKYIYIVVVLLISFTVYGQKADKVFKNFEKKDYAKAEEQFLKIVEKDTSNCAANFGLAYIYSTEESQKVDYFKAWDYFRTAYRNQDKLDSDDAEAIKLHIANIDSRRRSRPLDKNFDIEKDIIQDKLITFVREENNLEVAERFIQEYPSSDYIENVLHIRNYIEFRKAEDANTVAGYNLFLQKYPDAAQVEKVKQLRNKKAYAEAKAANTLSAINEFISKYPDAYEVFEAESLRNKLAFAEAKKSNNLKSIEDFIAKYPNSTEVAEAMQIKRQLLFEQAKSINTLEAYNNFVKLYPEGKQFVDIFNLKANVLGNTIKDNNQITISNVLYYKGFDRRQDDDVLKDFTISGDKTYVVGKTKIADDNWDAWVIALDNSGKMLWNKSFGQAFNDGMKCITVAASGNIYLGGIMNALGDSIKGISWIVKMSDSGQILWSKKLKGAKVKTIATDSQENIYAGGSFIDSLGYKCQLFKLNAEGETLWARNYITQGEIESVNLANDELVIFSGGNWIAGVSNEGYIKFENLIENCNSKVVSGVKEDQVYYAGFQDSTILNLGALDFTGTVSWTKELKMDSKSNLQSFSSSFASLQLLITNENSLLLYDFDLTGNPLSNITVNNSSFVKRAVYKNINGVNLFGASAKTFGQLDMFLIKYQ